MESKVLVFLIEFEVRSETLLSDANFEFGTLDDRLRDACAIRSR